MRAKAHVFGSRSPRSRRHEADMKLDPRQQTSMKSTLVIFAAAPHEEEEDAMKLDPRQQKSMKSTLVILAPAPHEEEVDMKLT